MAWLMIAAGALMCLATAYALRGGLVGQRKTEIVGLDMQGLLFGGLSIAAAMWFFGPMAGITIILAVVIHEYGHVAAFRVAGHADARFRLIPLMGGVAISDSNPASQDKDFFITLMGPAIGLGPMILTMGLSATMWEVSVPVAIFLSTFAMITGALNFFNMLPFWPLDGGKMLRVIAHAFWPPLAYILAIAMSAAFVAAGVAMQSFLLFFIALMGVQSLASSNMLAQVQRPLSRKRAVLAAAAYLSTAATFFFGGGYTFFLRFL